MNSKVLEILNLIEEKSFKKCEKLIWAGIKGKKNEKMYMLLRGLLHSYVNEIEECEQVLEDINLEDYDDNLFYILGIIYSNINKEEEFINLYEKKIKKYETVKKENEQILKNIYDYCLNNSFFKKGNNISLKLYKNTNNTKYILDNCYLLYLNNSNNNKQIYNLCLNFLTNYKNITYNKITEQFSLFLIIYFLNIKIRNYNECLKINEYSNINNFYVNTLQYYIYKFYLYFIFNKLEDCLNILNYIILKLPENTDYYILYMDIIIYYLSKNPNFQIIDIFKHYKNCLMYLEFCQKCFFNNYVKILKTIYPINDIYSFWKINIRRYNIINNSDNVITNSENVITNSENVITNSENVITNSENVITNSENVITNSENVITNSENVITNSENVITNSENVITNSENVITNSENVITNSENVITNSDNVINNSENIIANSDNIFKDILNFLLCIYKNEYKYFTHYNYNDYNIEINIFQDIINKIEENIYPYKMDIKKIYTDNNVRIYLYMLFQFILVESKNYNMFYSIKHHLSILCEDMIAIIIVFLKISLKILYNSVNEVFSKLSTTLGPNGTSGTSGTNGTNSLENVNWKKIILQFCKQIYNFEKILYVLYKKDVCDAFSRLFSLFMKITSSDNLQLQLRLHLRDDNIVVLLVEMALYMDQCEVCKAAQIDIPDDGTQIYNVVSSISEGLDLDGHVSIDDFLGKITLHGEEEDRASWTNWKSAEKGADMYTPTSHVRLSHLPSPASSPGDTVVTDSNNTSSPLGCEKQLRLANRVYYVAALRLLKYAYNYRSQITRIENEEKNMKPILNNDYINVLVLMIYLNNAIGNFTNCSTLVEKLNIKNIQLITYSPILFIHSFNYSYYNYSDNLLKIIFNYYTIQQSNLRCAISKCFQNYSFFKVNEIVNSYLLNSSNIFFYFMKLLYIFKKQLVAPKGGFYFNLFSRLKNNYQLHNEYKTKFPSLQKDVSNGKTRNGVNKGKGDNRRDISNPTDFINKANSTYQRDGLHEEKDLQRNGVPVQDELKGEWHHPTVASGKKSNFMNFVGSLNEDIIYDEMEFEKLYQKLLLERYHFLTTDNQTILVKLNIPSFRFTFYKLYDTFFYNHILYESLDQVNDIEFVKNVKVLNPIEGNSVNQLRDIKTIYPMIMLPNFYNMKGSVYLTSHEDIKSFKNGNDLLLNMKNISSDRDKENVDISFEKIKKHVNYSILQNEISFYTSDNTYVSFDKDNCYYKSELIFNTYSEKDSNINKSSITSPFTVCLTDIFNYPLQMLYLNSILLNTIMYIFHKAFYYYSFEDTKKEEVIKKVKCAFFYLIYIIGYYELSDPPNGHHISGVAQQHPHNLEDTSIKRDNDKGYSNNMNDIDIFKCAHGKPVPQDCSCMGADCTSVFFESYEIMQAVYHNDVYNKIAALYYKWLLLNMNMYIKVLLGKDIKDCISAIKCVYNSIYLHLFNDVNIFKELLVNDRTFQIVNLSCVFKKFNYLVHNITIFTLTIQSIYYQGRKKVTSDNNAHIKDLILKNTFLLSNLCKNLITLSEVLSSYPSNGSPAGGGMTDDSQEKFDQELINEFCDSYKQHVSNLHTLLNSKLLLMKSYL
ncbi:hypothetical protein, conserved [Plasmodium ovale curtisi]|uniref:Uncharacterized protein n=1 Tax=Plasmodium ovale curtisi TaxID=864141 RepID=A0A1A8W0Q5_PLAOA|nr:hypothetical protein, conserved [Plasmodium ovale curtisi]